MMAAMPNGHGGIPGWPITTSVSLVVTLVVVVLQMRKPSYHGLGWQRINPGLRSWWDASRTRTPNAPLAASRAMIDQVMDGGDNRPPPAP